MVRVKEEEIKEVLGNVIRTNKYSGLYTTVDVITEAIQGLLNLYEQEKEKNKKIENYCREDLAFERRLIRTNQKPNMFNEGRFYTSQNIINIICEKAEEKEE